MTQTEQERNEVMESEQQDIEEYTDYTPEEGNAMDDLIDECKDELDEIQDALLNPSQYW